MLEAAANGKEVLELLSFANFHLVLLDIEMPNLNGIETLAIIRRKYPRVKVMMLSSFSNEGQIEELYKRKIDGYLLKNVDFEELKRALTNIAEGRQYFCQEIANQLFHKLLPGAEGYELKELLTDREKEILMMICEQYSTTEIADTINLSPRTVDRFRDNLLIKTGSKNSIGLVLYAIRMGLTKA
jgi:DNA-binding NarL/FixJ family response regulator